MMKNRFLKTSLFFSLATFALSSQAKLITITPQAYATCTVLVAGDCDSFYQSAIDSALQQFEDQINASAGTGDYDQDKYFGGAANGAAMSSTGNGAVYNNGFDYFTVGVNLGAAGVLASGSSIVDVIKHGAQGNVVGAGGSASITIGANAGLLFKDPWFWGLVDPTRLKGYLGVFFFPLPLKSDSITGDIKATAVSAMAQYTLIPGMSLGLGALRWNGVNISSGLRYTRFSVQGTFSNPNFGKEYTLNINGDHTGATMFAPLTVDLDVTANNVAMPFEATTSVRLAYFLNLMVGTAFDFNVGSAAGSVDANVPTITIDQDDTATLTFTGNTTATTATTPYDGSGHPTILNWRAMVGLQLEFGVGGIYATLTKAVLKPQMGINLGMNFFY
jgi:hypothetical protein